MNRVKNWAGNVAGFFGYLAFIGVGTGVIVVTDAQRALKAKRKELRR